MLGGSNSDSVAGDQLRAFFERIERLDEEIKALNDDKKEVFAEAKGNGFDTKVMKIILKERRQDASERAETEALVELYRAALGMAALPADWGDDEAEDETGTPDATRAPAQAKSEPATSEPSGVAADQGEGTAPGSLANNSEIGSSEPSVRGVGPVATAQAAGMLPEDAPDAASTDAREGAPTAGEAVIDASLAAPTAADQARKLRPYCQHADDLRQCAGQGHKHCFACLKAHADEEGMAA